MSTTTDYAGRQIDVELLQSIVTLGVAVPVTVSNVSKVPKMVTGIEKLVQRYALLLLTNLGDVQFAQSAGGDFLRLLMEGYIQDVGQLNYAFASANNLVVTQLNTDDLNTAAFGTIPPDEAIKSAVLLDAQVDKGTSTAYLRVQIISQADTNFVFVVPVTKQQ